MRDMNRRSLITGLISMVAAPAIVRAGSLMPIKAEPIGFDGFIDHFRIYKGVAHYASDFIIPSDDWISLRFVNNEFFVSVNGQLRA